MDKKILIRLLKYLWKYKLFFLLSLLFGIVSVALTLYIPYEIGRAIDYIVGPSNVDFDKVIFSIFVVLLSCLIVAFCQYGMSLLNNKMVFYIIKDIRDEAFSKIHRLPLNYIDCHPFGEVVSRVISDIESLSDGILMTFNQLFTGLLTIFGTIGFMYSLNWLIATVVVVITPISLLVAKFIASKTYKMFKNQSKLRAEQTGFVDEMLSQLKTCQAYCQEEENDKKFEEINSRLEKCSLTATFISSLTNPCTRFVNSLVYVGVCFAGAYICVGKINGLSITVGCLSTFLSYANQYTKPFNEISSVISELQNSIACAYRVFELIDEKEEKKDALDAKNIENVSGDIDIEHVYFSYSKDKKLIQDFNLKAKKGQNIAIVGPTGCGKTTLINLLMRFYDIDEGKIILDGKDYDQITRKSLREAYGMVLQDTWIKKGTVRENIALGKVDATDEEIITACKNAHCHSFIKRLPQGYDTVISEEGNMSQGQRQLLCIARIMLCLPPMVILDEATSSIDTRTEIKIQEAFNKLTKERSAFIVAHRLSTIKNADIILVMKDGNIIEQGNHDELLKQGGFYSTLYNSQFPKK